MAKGRPRDTEKWKSNRESRDCLTKDAAKNVEDLAKRRPIPSNSPVYDFRTGKTRSPTVSSLKKMGEDLGVVPVAFLLPPDKRDAILSVLDMLYTAEPDEINQMRAALQVFVAGVAAGTPQQS